MKLRILHVLEAFGRKADGVAVMVQLMTEKLVDELDITIAANLVESSNSDIKLNIHQINLPPGPIVLQGATQTKNDFRHLIENFQPDIIHLHGVFSPLQRVAQRLANENDIPTLLSAHGMLEPWLWQQKGLLYQFLKRTFWYIIIYPTLSKTNYVHAITQMERNTLRKEFPNHPQIQIPNAIDLSVGNISNSKEKPEKTFVFLGRIHPKKGVDLLIRAFKKAGIEGNWKLKIIGPDIDSTYSYKLRHLASDLELLDHVEFIGPVYGNEKYAMIRKAWVVVVPSYSEVVALVNLEAAVLQTPTITTTSTGLADWTESGGILIEPGVEELTQAILSAASWTIDERFRRGKCARNFIEERYSWKVVGPRWIESYHQIAANCIKQ